MGDIGPTEEQPRLPGLLDSLASIEDKVKGVEEYDKQLTEYNEKKDKRKLFKFLVDLPGPQKVFTLVIGLILLGLGIHYIPQIFYFLVQNFQVEVPAVTNYLMISAILNIFLIVILFVIVTMTGEIVFIWLRAVIQKKPLLLQETKNRTLRFILPHEITPGMWTIGKDTKDSSFGSITPDPECINIGPCRVPIMMGIPEYAGGLSVRRLVGGKQKGMDMGLVRNYAEGFRQREWFANRNQKEDMAKMIIFAVVILVVIGGVFGPNIMKAMDQRSEMNKIRTQNDGLRAQVIGLGGIPFDYPTVQTQQQQTQTPQTTKPGPASTGMQIT